MSRMTCPDCDRVFKVPDDAPAAVRCPECGCRIRTDTSDDEDRKERKPRSQKSGAKKAREPERIQGLIPMLIGVPIALALGIAAVPNVKAAFAAAMLGFLAAVGAGLALYFLYKREGASHLTGKQTWGKFVSQIRLAFARPRTFGSWLLLEVLFTIVMLEGFTLLVILPKLGVYPHREVAANGPGEQPPAAGGNNLPDGGPKKPPAVNPKPPGR